MLIHRNPAAQNPRRVLILGSRGFISRHLQDWCARSGVDCLPVGSEDIDLTIVENASRLAALMRPDDAIVMTSVLTPDKGRDYATLMRNLRMAETVCRALDQAVCAQFVYLSSDAVYDAHQIPLDEDSTREATDLYALAHTAREMMLASAVERKKLPLCILRLTSIYGSGDTHNSYGPNRFVRSALSEGEMTLFGKGEEYRSHVCVDDAIELIGMALKHCSTGTLNVAADATVSFLEVSQIICGLAGKPIRLAYFPRTTPVLHRTFENRAVRAAFPDFRFTSLDNGLTRFMESEAGNIK